MEKAGRYMNGLSRHYYTIPCNWENKGSATEFNEAEWYLTMQRAWRMDDLVSRHSTIMDEFDPERKVGMAVDEWGTWLNAEPGSNPSFLYQQNSLRDALVAGIHLNIFNNHADRVHMANIAQTINVLQSVILTEGPKMILTPTYHVFDLYQVHQDAVMLPVHVETGELNRVRIVSASASQDDSGTIHVSLTNGDLKNEQELRLELRGLTLSPSVKVCGKIITASDMRAHNTFEKPDTVQIAGFSGVAFSGGVLHITMPPMSVVTVELT
jgi:alpha-N-arabinofuranosidase